MSVLFVKAFSTGRNAIVAKAGASSVWVQVIFAIVISFFYWWFETERNILNV
jgi:hypothetical protein